MDIARSGGAGRDRRAESDHHCNIADASGRGPGHLDDPDLRVEVSRVEQKRHIRSKMVALHQDRSRDLDCANSHHHRPGRDSYKSTHALDPYRPLESDVKPVTIEVVALDWKWVFIYPEQGIATVNKIVFPANTPVNFRITSDSVMNSFFIPGLGGQIYAMAGMTTKLHLIANKNAEMDGISANYSGAGFTGMKFKAIATSEEDFNAWVAEVKASPKQLDNAEYAALEKPSENNPVELYSTVTPNLFQLIIDKYEGMNPGKFVKHEKKEESGTQGLDNTSNSAAGAEE